MHSDLLEPSETGLTLGFAEELVTLSGRELDSGLRTQVDLLLLDHIGTALRGSEVPWGRAAALRAERYRGTGQAVVFGTGARVAPEIAAFANAVAAHAMELDDTHDASISHPGAVVFAAGLAADAETKVAPDTFRAAAVASYEAMARAGMATGAAGIIAHGFHPTALFGGFGAATMVALLSGFDAERLARAWGLMLSGIDGSMQFSEDPKGTTVKRLHAGYAARAGLSAVELATEGFDGPVDALSGRYGLCRIFGREPRLDLLQPADRPLQITQVAIKPYPCCRLFHSTLDALRELTDGFTLDTSRIARITVGGSAIAFSQHMLRRPTSVMAAQYNLPHIAAAALLHGPASYEGYGEDKLADPAVLALADRVQARVSEKMEAAFPERAGSEVEIELTDRTIRRHTVMDSLGTPRRPMDRAAVRAKLEGLATPRLSHGMIDVIDAAIDAMDGEGSLRGLLEAIGGAAATYEQAA